MKESIKFDVSIAKKSIGNRVGGATNLIAMVTTGYGLLTLSLSLSLSISLSLSLSLFKSAL